MSLYDDYVWRLVAVNPALDIRLPKDLEWVDEFTWAPVKQNVTTSLSGALVIQESVQKKGRPITLQGFDDMAWVKRSKIENLATLRDTAGLVMKLSFVEFNGVSYGIEKFSYDVMFRHYEPPVIDFESVKRFDGFDPASWFKVKAMRFMEAIDGAANPCTANVTLTLTNISGTFSPGQVVTGGTPEVSGTVMSFSGSTLTLFVDDGEFQSTDTITGATGSATVA